ncbi:outer membrane beta-barrel protein [Algoriphagus machipongonensis]|uniref:Outer membrane protein beta-barrel domain-containing protein n=1 Tax=Algoriphagus machipongonensis TaxID=388413 RepID=A3I3D2_9BACT|nr:outer membrane beta-barrel protein [Algoriphagus machipongonensis]EAZ79069.1 hypothetical protein ALPR1_13719 [Algoriphagus machipongonensis]
MKKLLVLVTMVLISFSGFSQIKSKASVGLSFSNFSNDVNEAKAQPGFQLGTNLIFGNKFYFEPGIFYLAKSTEFVTENSTGSTTNFSADVKGFRVPVGVGVNLLGDGTSNFDIHASGGFSGYFITGVGDDFEKDDFENPTWGTYLSAGIDIWKIFLDATYEWSLTNVQKDVSAIDLGKHRNLYINLGVKLNFGQ